MPIMFLLSSTVSWYRNYNTFRTFGKIENQVQSYAKVPKHNFCNIHSVDTIFLVPIDTDFSPHLKRHSLLSDSS